MKSTFSQILKTLSLEHDGEIIKLNFNCNLEIKEYISSNGVQKISEKNLIIKENSDEFIKSVALFFK